MKVVQVDLAIGLKFVDEVEETKGEGSVWSLPSSREPSNAEQLDMWWDIGSRVALAVGDVNCMSAGHVEYGERNVRGRYLAGGCMVMAKVEDGAQVFERHACKIGSSPTLKKMSIRATEFHG